MGIIQKQAIKGTVYSYIGVLIGFTTTAILFPHILTTDQIGLLKLLVSFSVLFAQLGSLGFNNVLNRLFPQFRDYPSKHNGFIAIALLITIVGFVIISIAFELYKPVLIRNNIEDSALLVEYVDLIFPLIFAILFFNLFDTYNKVLYDTVLGAFLKEFLQRALILISILLYFFNLIDLQNFVIAYIISFLIPTLILLGILIQRGTITFNYRKEAFTKPVIREMTIISLFGFTAGLGGLAIIHIDTLLVNKFLGISMTGIYATTFFFGTLVLIPSRPLIKISTTILADSWNENNVENIKTVYAKSCLNQAIIAVLVFIGIWVNIHNVFKILPEEFEAGKYVILFISLANVFEMTAGVSGMVIGTSRYYKLNALFIFVFLALLVGMNYIFIPLFGITGAAIATAISKLLYTLVRYTFLRIKYDMQPYNYKFLVLILIATVSYLAGYFIPEIENYFLDIPIRSLVVLIVFSVLILAFRVSADVNSVYETMKTKLKNN
jgi:O-antigen/teichoic acid export membrane protein